MTFTELIGHVGFFGGAVMICLAVLSVFSIGVIVDKHRRLSGAWRQSQSFKPVFKKFLHGGKVQDLINGVSQHENSYVAQVVSAGIHEYDGVRKSGGDQNASLELVTSALRDSPFRDPDPVEGRSRLSGYDRFYGSLYRSFRHRSRNH